MKTIPRQFNTAGPCIAEDHYLIDPLSRLPKATKLIDSKAYFVVHAPRQTGKTTTLHALARSLTAEGRYAALYFSCEVGAVLSGEIDELERALIQQIAAAAVDDLPKALRPPVDEDTPKGVQLNDYLRRWAKACPRPLVLFFDEIDALRDDGLRSVLQQLRAGFPKRPNNAPHAVILCGLRDVRDYKVASGGEVPVNEGRLGTASPFNIKVTSTRLAAFTEVEVRTLLEQHTEATGQVFSVAALAKVFYYAEGQPWLTNALAAEVIDGMEVEGEITEAHIDRAKENLVLARATHLDSLVARLMEQRVRRILVPMMEGTMETIGDTYDDDLSYVHDLGLVKLNPAEVANPIYREVIMRVLSSSAQQKVHVRPQSFVLKDGSLDFEKLLKEFIVFWREHGEVLTKGMPYREVAPQLVLMAFFQRVVNGGGYIDREYATGRGRIDLLLRWPLPNGRGMQRHAIELKVWHDKQSDPLERGLDQLDGYLDQLSMDTGLLVIFDRRKKKSKPKSMKVKVSNSPLSETESSSGRTVRVLRL